MKSTLVIAILIAAVPVAWAQGSGAPSPAGQSESTQGASSAERAVQARHDKAVAHSQARSAKRAAKAASAASR